MSSTSRQKTSVPRSNKSKPFSYKISTRATNRNTMSETENKETTKPPVSNASEAGSSSSQKNLLKLFCNNHKLMLKSMRCRTI